MGSGASIPETRELAIEQGYTREQIENYLKATKERTENSSPRLQNGPKSNVSFQPIENPLSTPIPFNLTPATDNENFAGMSNAPSVLSTGTCWIGHAILYEREWEVYIRSYPSRAEKSHGIILFLHGLGKDRCGAFFFRFWDRLTLAGFNIIAMDFPGHGQSSEKSLPARPANFEDSDLILACLIAFGANEESKVTCFTDAGGAAPFLRAYCSKPSIFGHHHILLNPIIAEVPLNLKKTLEENGSDLSTFFSDGWSENDTPFKCACCGPMFGFVEEAPNCARICMLIPTGILSMFKAMKPSDYLVGATKNINGVSKSSKFFFLKPSAECQDEFLSYISAPANEVVLEAPAAPNQTALELGVQNSNFKVFVRIRPMLAREQDSDTCLQVTDVEDFPIEPPPQRVSQFASINGCREICGEFVFDRVFAQDTTQNDVYVQAAEPLVRSFLEEGINATMFAYGQTGTGKTFTMEGSDGLMAANTEGVGIMRRVVETIFQGIPPSKTVQFQYVQLYNADWLDLLNPSNNAAALVVEERENMTRIRNATVCTAANASAMMAAVAHGAQFRASGKTNMNDASSRSHAILIITLVERASGDVPDGVEGGPAMYLVDLAGSERTKRSGVTGHGFTEAVQVNLSLSALGRVVSSLVENDGKRALHVSYWDSPLTHLLKSGLGGCCKTSLICCVTGASDSLDETKNTLRFALQASHVKNKVAAKDKQDAEEAKLDAIENAGNDLVLSCEGTGEIPLSNGIIPVFGNWNHDDDGRPPVIFVHDFQRDGLQYSNLVDQLKSKGVRVLSPTFTMNRLKEDGKHSPEAGVVQQLLDLLDWLGVPKAVLVGYDYGALICTSFKMKHPTRVTTLVLENKVLNLDEKEFRKKMKKDPMFINKMLDSPWQYIYDWCDPATSEKRMKKFRGRVFLIWPLQKKGLISKCGEEVAKALKTRAVDSSKFEDAERIEYILKARISNKKKKGT